MSLSVGATVGFLIIHLILLYSLLALIVFYGCLFYKKRREMIIRKRYAMIVFIINLSVIPMFAITFPFIYIKWFISNIKLDQGIIWSLTYPFCAYGMSLFTALRYYMIYYDTKFLISSKNLKWKKYITQDPKTLQTDNYYISHRHTLGNEKFMVKLCTCIVCTFGTIQMILKLLENNHVKYLTYYRVASQIMDVCFFIGPITLSFVTWFKTPLFLDKIYIREEMRYICIGAVICIVLYIICIVVGVSISANHPLHIIFLRVISAYAGIAAFVLASFLSTFLVLRYIKTQSKTLDNSATNMDNSTSGKNIGLDNILSDSILYDLFMHHLMKEFSFECLLSFTEFFEYYRLSHQVFGLTPKKYTDIDFGESFPKSAIVYSGCEMDSMTMDNIKIKMVKSVAYQLHHKYVDFSSEFEINISGAERNKLMLKFGNETQWMDSEINPQELCDVFSYCMLEMHQLMKHSMTRFKSTEQFKKYVKSHNQYV
eukprot:74828_1